MLDAVNFDTFSDYFACHRPSELLDGVGRFCRKHPDVFFICFNPLGFPQENLTQNEQFILSNAVGRATILNNFDKPVFALNRYYDTDGIAEVLNAPKSYHDINGVRGFEDTHGKCVNTAGGHRVTAYQPKHHRRTIFTFGECCIFGVGSSDEHTIASFLQKLFNEQMPEQSKYFLILCIIRRMATGLWLKGCLKNSKKESVDFKGTGAKQPMQNDYGFDRDKSNELAEYKKILVNFYEEMFSVEMGVIVMN